MARTGLFEAGSRWKSVGRKRNSFSTSAQEGIEWPPVRY